MADSTAAPRPAGTFGPVAAAAYERSMGRWSRRLAPLLLDFAGVDGARRILDVGCGTGSLTFAAAERHPGAMVMGCDWARLKEWRAVATCYEKTACCFMGILCMAATMDWIK